MELKPKFEIGQEVYMHNSLTVGKLLIVGILLEGNEFRYCFKDRAGWDCSEIKLFLTKEEILENFKEELRKKLQMFEESLEKYI